MFKISRLIVLIVIELKIFGVVQLNNSDVFVEVQNVRLEEFEKFKIANTSGLKLLICILRCSRILFCESIVYNTQSNDCLLSSARPEEKSNLETNLLYKTFIRRISSFGRIIQRTYEPLASWSIVRLKNGDIACGCADGNLKIWNIYENKIVKVFTGHTNIIRSVIELSNGDIATAAYDLKIIIWDPISGSQKKVLLGHTDLVCALAEVNSETIVSGSYDKTIRLWNKTSSNSSILYISNFIPVDIKLHPNGLLICAFMNEEIKMINPNTGNIEYSLVGSNGSIFKIALWNENILASSFSNGTINVWNLTSRQLISNLVGHSNAVDNRIDALIFLKNGLLASGSYDKLIKIWDPTNGQLIKIIYDNPCEVIAFELTENGYLIASYFCGSSTIISKIIFYT